MKNSALLAVFVSVVAGGVSLLAASPASERVRDFELTLELSAEELDALTRDPWNAPGIPGWILDGDGGQPLLPARIVQPALPRGTRIVSVELLDAESRPLETAGTPYVEVAGEGGTFVHETGVDSREIVTPGLSGTAAGEDRGAVVFHAIQCRPASPDGSTPASTTLCSRARVRVRLASTEASGTREQAVRPLRDATPAHGFSGPDGTGEFFYLRPGDYPTLDGSTVEYLIITNREMECDFQRLADWRTLTGHPSVVRRLDWIDAQYPGGIDQAERIRLFIRDAYQKWGVRWVLLAGDTDVIPVRKAHVRYYYPAGEDIATDLYYACLDGTWDRDGDGIYGEGWHSDGSAGDSADVFPDVFLGRAPVAGAGEAKVFVDKTIKYQTTANSGYGRAVFAAEVIEPFIWDQDPASIMLNGDRIAAIAGDEIDGGFGVRYMCQYTEDSTLDADFLTPDSLVDAINAGYGFVSCVDHGDAFKLRVTGTRYLRIGDLDALTNSNCYSIFSYVNCSTSQIDAECVNEALILNPGGGAVAAFAPTRFAFPLRAQFYLEEFYRSAFRRDLATLGEICAQTMLVFAPFGSTGRDDHAQRWTHLSCSLLGDPMLPVWRKAPTSLTASHGASVALGDTSFTVTVSSGGSAVSGATVTLMKHTGEYARGRTDGAGLVRLPFRAGSRGEVFLTVTHPEHTPYSATLQATPSTAVPFVSQFVVDDDAVGSSAGNGDGRADAGETVELAVTLANNSGAALNGVNAALQLAGGASFTVLLEVDGSAARGLLFTGAESAHPGSLPASYSLDDPTLRSRPVYSAGAADDSTGGAVETPSGNVTGRWYLWSDGGGLHLRAAGGLVPHDFEGYLVTGGRVLGVSPAGSETDDFWIATADSIGFSFSTDSTEAEDGLDIVFADSLAATIVDGSESYGNISAGTRVTRKFVVQIPSTVRDGYPARFDLAVSSAAGTWHDGFRMDVSAPDVVLYYQEIDDPVPGGNGNGIPEAGETVRITPHVLNRGSGSAAGVVSTLRPLAGASATDSSDTFGTVTPANVRTGTGFIVDVASPTASFEVEFRDAASRVRTTTATFPPPAVVTGVTGMVPPDIAGAGVDLGWNPSASPGLAGYLVYRSASPSGPDALASPRLLGRSAYFHDPGALPGTLYYYRVAAVDSAGTRGPLSARVPVLAPAAERAGWPNATDDVLWSSPLIADLHEDTGGDREIAVASKDSRMYVWQPGGAYVSGWPRHTNQEVWSSPAAADLDGNGAWEIVTGSNDGLVYSWRANGAGYLQENGLFGQPSIGGEFRGTPAIGDLDNNGQLDVVIGSTNRRLYAWRANGSSFIGTGGLFKDINNGQIHASPTLANVDGDPQLEIFIGTTGGGGGGTARMWAFNHDGSALLPGMGAGTGEFAVVPGGFLSSASIADIDNNGIPEIACGGVNDSVYVWEPDGSRRPGWPRRVIGGRTFNNVYASFAIGDIDGDPDLELVVGSRDYRVYAWNPDGSYVTGWPQETLYEVWGSPILVDVDNDHRAEVVIGSGDGLLYAWNGDGSMVDGWPLRTGDDIFGTPAAGDLNGDGMLEVAVGSYDGMMHVWNLGVPVNEAANPWPMYRHDPYRSGSYATPQPATGPAAGGAREVPALSMLDQNSPNPFNPDTEIRFGLQAAGPVELLVFDVGGRRVKTLVSERMDAGFHLVNWDGRDDQGDDVAAGIYFARLSADGRRLDRKMVLVR